MYDDIVRGRKTTTQRQQQALYYTVLYTHYKTHTRAREGGLSQTCHATNRTTSHRIGVFQGCWWMRLLLLAYLFGTPIFPSSRQRSLLSNLVCVYILRPSFSFQIRSTFGPRARPGVPVPTTFWTAAVPAAFAREDVIAGGPIPRGAASAAWRTTVITVSESPRDRKIKSKQKHVGREETSVLMCMTMDDGGGKKRTSALHFRATTTSALELQ